MTPCFITHFTTPTGVNLSGLWFGEKEAETVYIIVHGLGSSMFSNHELFLPLVSRNNSVFFFNNRGHDTITRIKKIDNRRKKGYRSILAGKAHEVFTDCADDIAGAITEVERIKPKKIILLGHSTGCQKIVYYLAKKRDKRVSQIILLSPMSDYAGIKHSISSENLKDLQKIAQTLVQSGNLHTLLPQTIWPAVDDAQRFLSLATSTSPEELFPYSHSERKPTELQKITIPILVILAEKDEFRDRSVKKIAAWFDRTIKAPHKVIIISNANHSFSGYEKEVTETIRKN